MGEEKSILRWGGLAGILGGILFIVVPVILLGLVAPEPSDPEALVSRFPDVRPAVALGEGLYLAAVMMWVALFLALYHALRGAHLAPALFGSVLAILGLAVLATSALPNVGFIPISDLYHASGTTPEEKATLVLLWQATQGIFNEVDTTGFLLWTTGFIILGVAMLKTPAFGRVFGGLSIVLGALGIVGISIFGVYSLSFAPFGFPAYVVFPLLFGWKVYRLSKTE